MDNDRLHTLMTLANQLALQCPVSDTAFSVGAVLTDAEGGIIATGYSRELGDGWHAEQVAIEKAGPLPEGDLVMVTSLEPCSVRASGKRPCCTVLVEKRIATVVVGAREPAIFVEGKGCETLQRQGLKIIELEGFADSFRQANRHLLPATEPA